MSDKYIDKFKKGTEEYAIYAEHAISADTSLTAVNAEKIGNVSKYSGYFDGKQREGLRIVNNSESGSEGLIELNSKGNLALESKTNHVNIEAVKQVKIKPTTKMIWDSSRKIEAGNGNEFEIEAVNDELATTNPEKWAELKIKSRNLDLRCHNHGGIALQIAGADGGGN